MGAFQNVYGELSEVPNLLRSMIARIPLQKSFKEIVAFLLSDGRYSLWGNKFWPSPLLLHPRVRVIHGGAKLFNRLL
jgi:hypothetical protein